MVGGTVSIVQRAREGEIQIQVVGEGCERYDRLAVNVPDNEETRRIQPGDSMWWQSDSCYWTPRANRAGLGRSGIDYDLRIKRIGYSYRPTPEDANNRKEAP